MKEIDQGYFSGERAVYKQRDLRILNSVFVNGESPLKECENIEVRTCMFEWMYPIWYSKLVRVDNCTFFSAARAGVWYVDDIEIKDSIIEAPKCIRRCDGVKLTRVNISGGEETLWHCKNVKLSDVSVKGNYFAMNSEGLDIDGLSLVGKYSFDGVKDVVIRNSKLLTKDAFWNSENVTVYDSVITGEYIGWNAKNLTFINCTIESLQGMCYIDGLKMQNCRLINTTLAFEYSKVEADIVGKIDGVFNPTEGRIVADRIGELVVDRDAVDPDKTIIICREGN